MLSMTIFPARLSCQDPQGLEPYLEQWHPPRNLCRTSTRPGTLHTVLISMGTTLGGCSFMSWTLERQPGVTSEQAHPHPPAFPGESLGSYLRRVSLMSCGRDMWHQCLSPGPGQPPPEGPPKPQTCPPPPHTYAHMVRNCPWAIPSMLTDGYTEKLGVRPATQIQPHSFHVLGGNRVSGCWLTG